MTTAKERQDAKAKTLKPTRPNAGIQAAYRKRLDKLIAEMNRSVQHWVATAYKTNEPRIAQDAAPADVLKRVVKELAERWQTKFDELAPKLADYFATSVQNRTDAAMKKSLRDAGWTVPMRMSPAQRDVLKATVNQNVALIKSIPQRYFTEVEGAVMRSVQTGRDLGQLTKDLEQQYGVTRRRAATIALNQNNSATAAMSAARQTELGIQEGEWMHSHAGKEPRPTHVAMNGKRFKISEGMYDPAVGERILPGQLINCLPGDALVDLVNGCHEIWRYDYRGDMVALEAGESVVTATPNHPFLTQKGWIAAEDIQVGDYVWKARHQKFDASVTHVDETKFRIADVFSALGSVNRVTMHDAAKFNFHGDIPDSEVEAVRAEFGLFGEVDPSGIEGGTKLDLSKPNRVLTVRTGVVQITHASLSGFGSDGAQRIGIGLSEARDVCSAAIAGRHSVTLEPPHDDISRHGEVVGDCEDAVACAEHRDDLLVRKILEVVKRHNLPAGHDASDDLGVNAVASGDVGDRVTRAVEGNDLVEVQFDPAAGRATLLGFNRKSIGAEVLAQLIGVYAKMGCKVFEAGEFIFEAISVRKKLRSENSSGHVYTMQSNNGWYYTSAENVVTQNCHCTWKPVITGFS